MHLSVKSAFDSAQLKNLRPFLPSPEEKVIICPQCSSPRFLNAEVQFFHARALGGEIKEEVIFNILENKTSSAHPCGIC